MKTSGKMIVFDSLIQGSEAWFQARKGRATASQAKKILTPTGKLSASRLGYMRSLAAECVVDDPLEWEGNKYTDWGNVHEPEARGLFEEYRKLKVEEVGFCVRTDNIIGCSPDGLIVDSDGNYLEGLEIKCPSRDKHVEYIMEGVLPSEYKLQVHWSMATTGLKGWWFMSYFPGLNPFLTWVEPDSFTDKVKTAMDDFIIEYAEERKRVLDKILPKTDEEYQVNALNSWKTEEVAP